MSRSTIRWPRIIAEGAAIVASILLALAADSWMESRRLHAAYVDVVRALEADFAEARSGIGQLESINQVVLAKADSVAGALAQSSGSVDVSPCDLATLTRTPTLDLPMGELQSLIASGGLDMIQDSDLRRQLAEWPAAVADVDDKSDLHTAFVYEQFLPVLRDHVPLRPLVDSRFALSQCSPDDLSVALPATPEMVNLLEHLRLMPTRTIGAYSWTRLTGLLEDIEASIARVLTS